MHTELNTFEIVAATSTSMLQVTVTKTCNHGNVIFKNGKLFNELIELCDLIILNTQRLVIAVVICFGGVYSVGAIRVWRAPPTAASCKDMTPFADTADW